MTGVTMGAREVANVLRPNLQLQHPDPHDQHSLNFLKEVATHLGLDHTAEVITHLAGLMREHGLKIHSGHEYPKWVVRKADGARFEAVDETDEERIVNEVPEHLKPQPGNVGHVADVHIEGDNAGARSALEHEHVGDDGRTSDISRQVPRQVPVTEKSALDRRTDRDAAQGQRPLMSDHDKVGGHTVVDDKSGLHHDHFSEQEPGAAAMRQGLVDTDYDDGAVIEGDDEAVHDQPAAKPAADLSRRPK